MNPRRPPKRPLAASAGYTLVEVVVAMLISSIMVAAVFGVALTSSMSGGSGMHKIMADQAMAQVSAQLKGFVTACGCVPNGGTCGAECAGLGPNSQNANNTWSLNVPIPPGGGITDSAGDAWALACGPHNLIGVVPGLETLPPNSVSHPGSVISYSVTWTNGLCGNGNPPGATDSPSIVFSGNWSEP